MTDSNPSPSGILIVDDHEDMRELLAEYLAVQPNLDVRAQAASGAEALEKVRSEPFDLALIDVSMPDMNGIELVRQLRQVQPELLCLMLSGHAEDSYISRSMEAGAHGYVLKGDPVSILEAIKKLLSGGTYLSKQAGMQE